MICQFKSQSNGTLIQKPLQRYVSQNPHRQYVTPKPTPIVCWFKPTPTVWCILNCCMSVSFAFSACVKFHASECHLDTWVVSISPNRWLLTRHGSLISGKQEKSAERRERTPVASDLQTDKENNTTSKKNRRTKEKGGKSDKSNHNSHKALSSNSRKS